MIEENYVSNIREYAERVQIFDDDDDDEEFILPNVMN